MNHEQHFEGGDPVNYGPLRDRRRNEYSPLLRLPVQVEHDDRGASRGVYIPPEKFREWEIEAELRKRKEKEEKKKSH
ncbi:hypothetical protein K2P56_03860 [Patescibacteria group bacterium]|nr:hypothetical protein [Patescibacteria group bacterium]